MDAPTKIETVTPASLALLDAHNGLLKVYITLCTGAVVLFVNAIFVAHVSLWALLLLAGSTFSFGLTALLCLSLMGETIKFRTELVQTARTGATASDFNKRIDDWTRHITGIAKPIVWLFGLGIIFAAASITAVCLTRLDSAILRH